MSNEYTVELLLTLDVDVDSLRTSVDEEWLKDILEEIKDYLYDMDGVTVNDATARMV
jgi:hypothetical protein